MPTLTKLSRPGWDKQFKDDAELREFMRTQICQQCKTEYGVGLQDMLYSVCGAEYMYDPYDGEEPCYR